MSSGCMMECEVELALAPPPPPPIPTFLRDPVRLIQAHNGSCDLCGWAFGDQAHLVDQITRTYSVVDDVWYFIIVSGFVGVVLISILIFVLALRCKETKVKLHQQITNKQVNKLGNGESFIPPGAINPVNNPHLQHHHQHPLNGEHHHQHPLNGEHHYQQKCSSKAVWSGIHKRDLDGVMRGRDGGGSYILQHHIINPDSLFSPQYEKIDYGSLEHATRVESNATRVEPHAIGGQPHLGPGRVPPTPLPPPMARNEVHFTLTGHAYYANPDTINGSFDNNGFDDSEINALIRKPSSASGFRALRRPGSTRVRHNFDRHRLPHVRTTNSGPIDHLVIKDGSPTPTLPGYKPHLPMVTQLHCDRIRSTALV